ncbi:glycoside hydrolase family 43 protein [Paractinoplanes toevensis]|uniref:Glycoside hydrolase 43 family protein n=1 Tax=Paractinoplanes toevensis TaxID=571911 RepID=A0A919T902_9ACTN|nr:glycoside hydrolase family 43 protein [Actinoplanes toevensis]GIM90085.1 glycoside hydrolase 43 family protein [Actinoplanes toevensis]
MTRLFNPLIPGFNPDPSVVEAGGAYYLVTSTFEYVPGIPVHRSTDFETWELIGHVGVTAATLGVAAVPTGLGVWAPTIRYRDGLFHVIVTIPFSAKRCVLFTAADPAGPWDEGITIDGIDGIDPDLAWDTDGNAYVTYSGLVLSGDDLGAHNGILQARVDLRAGTVLETPRSLWSGTGLMFPEAPHVFHRDEHWYLMIAEGGTERGHGVSIARGPSIEGPFQGAPGNPVLSARSTSRPIQNTGHADLVTLPDGDDALVLLGMRPLGATRQFSPLGRETFATRVRWVDGWPRPEPVTLDPRPGEDTESFSFAEAGAWTDPGWIRPRGAPAEVAHVSGGRLVINGAVGGMAALRPAFAGRRQRHHTSATSVTIDATNGAGGLALRYDEGLYIAIEARGSTVTATAVVSTLRQEWTATLPPGEITLRIETAPPPEGFGAEATGGDRIRLLAAAGGEQRVLTELDGRHWSAESAGGSFTGRVTGMFAAEGTVSFGTFSYRGSETSGPDRVTPAAAS